MRFIVMTHNEHELSRLPRFAAENGFDMYSIRGLSIIASATADQTHSALIPARSPFRSYDYEQGGRVRKEDYICMQPSWYPSLFADGTVVGCEQDFTASAKIGRIDDQIPFRKGWYGRRATRLRDEIRRDLDTHSFCRHCPARDRRGTDTSLHANFLNPSICNPIVVRKGQND
jgi:radical SAM protein with 4Fe4S-binding SPASM domain